MLHAGLFGKSTHPLHSSTLPDQLKLILYSCKLPNVDPDTGIRHKAEPDRALRKFRDVDEGAPKMGCMGMQLCPMFPDAKSAGMLQSYIEVGMDIDVKQRAYHVYIEQ